MSGIFSTPWTRRAISPTERAAIEAMLPPAYDVWLGAESPRGPFTAFLIQDRTRIESSRSSGWTPRQAVSLALRTLDHPDSCHWCGRDVSNGDFVNVDLRRGVVVRCCGSCWESAE